MFRQLEDVVRSRRKLRADRIADVHLQQLLLHHSNDDPSLCICCLVSSRA